MASALLLTISLAIYYKIQMALFICAFFSCNDVSIQNQTSKEGKEEHRFQPQKRHMHRAASTHE